MQEHTQHTRREQMYSQCGRCWWVRQRASKWCQPPAVEGLSPAVHPARDQQREPLPRRNRAELWLGVGQVPHECCCRSVRPVSSALARVHQLSQRVALKGWMDAGRPETAGGSAPGQPALAAPTSVPGALPPLIGMAPTTGATTPTTGVVWVARVPRPTRPAGREPGERVRAAPMRALWAGLH